MIARWRYTSEHVSEDVYYEHSFVPSFTLQNSPFLSSLWFSFPVAFTLAVTYAFKSVLYESHRCRSYEELLLVYVLSSLVPVF
jgi:hypothetical protein